MTKKNIISAGVVTLITIGLIFILGFDRKSYKEFPSKLYQVYLNGETPGVITNKDELFNLIDKEQKSLKDKYKVNKIYPPNGLEVMEIVTYDGEIEHVKNIYEKMKDIDPFTVKGYEITIKGEEKTEELYLLKKEDFDTAVNNTAKAFLTVEQISNYLEGTQEKIVDEGVYIDSIDLNEEISIKEVYISTEKQIFTNSNDLSRYILFGTMEAQESYVVSQGDTIAEVAYNNSLSIEEFLIANPEIKSANALLFPGQEVKVGLINPVVGIKVITTQVEKQSIEHGVKVEYDSSLTIGTSYVKQSGSDGLSKVTFKIESLNGDMKSAVKLSAEEISPSVDEIIVKGGKSLDYHSDGNWVWPTIRPYVITSYWGWRWGRWHAGIDISGTGHGSPIYAARGGTIAEIGYNGTLGNYIYLQHDNGYVTGYEHMSGFTTGLRVGSEVSQGQILGGMGNTGFSTGTHLHFEAWIGGMPYRGGTNIDPMTLFR